jgi:alpha-L-fucosidase
MNTPYNKDIISMLSNACHRRNVPLCLYYAIVDNNNLNYPNKGRAHELPFQPQDAPDINKYMDFLKAQVRELCSNYGEIHGFWWDANRLEIKDPSINTMIRKLQPKAVINDRGFDEGDFGTPERDFHTDDTIVFNKPTEACQSVGIESWGYRENEDYYTDRHLIRSINRYLVRDANYLLNVGPMANGKIPNKSTAILKRIGKWYDAVKESLENVIPAPNLTTNRNVMLTRRDRTVYVHLNEELPGNVVKLKPINIAPGKATLLNDGREIDFIIRFSPSDHKEGKAYLNLINLPVSEFCNTVLVIKLDFNCSIDDLARPTSPKDGILDSNISI